MAKKNKKETTAPVTIDNLEDFIWMSYRYCIGRHTIAAAFHASTIVKYVKHLTKERQNFMATDIRRELSDILQFKQNFMVQGYTYKLDAISVFLKWLATNPIEFNADFLIKQKFTIDTDACVVYLEDLEIGDKRDKLIYDIITNDFHDALPWIKLANYLDKSCHKTAILDNEETEVFPYYSFDNNNAEIHWVSCEQYEKTPVQGWYIAPEHLKFKEENEDSSIG